MNISKLAAGALPYMTELRRSFHREPELSEQEYKTSERICSELDALGIPYDRVCETGVIATIKGRADSPVVGLRADMDALAIREDSAKPYASCVPGVMHACGHDAHMAILLGAARILCQNRADLPGTVKLIFQPAEEIMRGGKAMAAHPLLSDLDNIAALHVWSPLQVGTINIEPGIRMASSDLFEITVHGKSAHGSMPHQGTDALYVASLIETALQGLVSRQVDPLESVALTIAQFSAGTAQNVLAATAHMKGTLRTFNNDLREWLQQRIAHIATHISLAFDARCEVAFTDGTPCTVNDEISAEVARSCAVELFGPDAPVPMRKTTGSEDFAFFLERTPGLIAFVGCSNPEQGIGRPHHHEQFDIDENALVMGAAFFVGYVLKMQAQL